MQNGINTITLKLNSWASLEKGKSDPRGEPRSFGYPVMPVGASHQGWGSKLPGIYSDIWLEFYDKAYMKYILAIPDIDNEQVIFRIWLDSPDRLPPEINASVRVRSKQNNRVVSETRKKLSATREYQEIVLTMEDPMLWSPENGNLYLAELEIDASGKLYDKASFHFGMRKIEVKNGDYYLNNQRIRFHGSNLVGEWLWGYEDNVYNLQTREYIVNEAKNMNLNSFRTHTKPPPSTWLDTCDPTRPTFRTGEKTVETMDIHPCFNFNNMIEGGFFNVLENHA